MSTSAWTNVADGTTCTDDGNAATVVNTCTNGTCGGCVPAGHCSMTTTMTCAFNEACGSGETCVVATPPSPRFVDNSDGTVTDRQTCLVWEKKTGTVSTPVFCSTTTTCPNPHVVTNTYQLSNTGTAMDGGAFTDFLVKLNSGTGFAGHTDWRLPASGGAGSFPTGERPELESIVDGSQGFCGGGSGACIAPIFGPTAAAGYWSSSTNATDPLEAWFVFFNNGDTLFTFKSLNGFVRAVRGGP